MLIGTGATGRKYKSREPFMLLYAPFSQTQLGRSLVRSNNLLSTSTFNNFDGIRTVVVGIARSELVRIL